MKLPIVFSTTLLAGCAVPSSLQRVLPLPGVGDGRIAIPNVFDMPKIEAIAALRVAGYQGDVSDAPGQCGSVVDGRVIELGHVCAQMPSPGSVQGARLRISLRIQDENPWHGSVGQITEWYLMPQLVGKSIEAARAELVHTGFHNKEHAKLVWVDQPGCRPLTVCETYPEAMHRAGVNSDMLLSVARDPSAPAVDSAAAEVRMHTATPPERAAKKSPEGTPKPKDQKSEPKPDPFF